MSRLNPKRVSKTLNEIKVLEVHFVRDETRNSLARTNEVKTLIAQMIELSRKRGRPALNNLEEDLNAA